MRQLSDVQFECLDAISANGALCCLPEGMGATGTFIAVASPRVSMRHPGWDIGVVNALYLMGFLRKSESGEYTITPRGEKACADYRAGKVCEAIARAVQDNPGKVVRMKDFRK